MSEPVTMPMSMAAVGYALFALQQSVPMSELEPIKFNVSGPALGLAEWNPVIRPGETNTVVAEGSEGVGLAAPVGAPLALGEEVAVGDPVVAAPAASVDAVGMFGAVPDSAVPAFVAGDEIPAAEAPAEQDPGIWMPKLHTAEEQAEEDAKPGAPRAAQQIGLLRELSFLDG